MLYYAPVRHADGIKQAGSQQRLTDCLLCAKHLGRGAGDKWMAQERLLSLEPKLLARSHALVPSVPHTVPSTRGPTECKQSSTALSSSAAPWSGSGPGRQIAIEPRAPTSLPCPTPTAASTLKLAGGRKVEAGGRPRHGSQRAGA